MLEIQNTNQVKRFILKQKPASFFVKLILVLITVSCIASPFATILHPAPSKGAIYGAMLCAFLGLFFFRMCLWNLFGKEIFERRDQELIHYIDYKLFKDELFHVENVEEISWKRVAATNAGLFHLSISKNEKEVSKSSIPLDEEEIEELLSKL